MSTTMSQQNLVEIASEDTEFTTLVAAVKAAGLVETLSGPGRFTVFAPIDTAFAALPSGTLDHLLKPENRRQLTDLLTYHVVPGVLSSREVRSGEVTTLHGARFTVSVDGGSVMITDGRGGTAKVIQADVAASNGLIHVIDHVLLPS